MQKLCVGIRIYEEVEVLDFCGPFEVFSVTRVNEEQRREESSPFQAILVAETSGAVTATGGMQVLLVEHYFGEKVARATARHMEYPYPDVDARRIQL